MDTKTLPQEFYRDCAFFMQNESFKFLLARMRHEAIESFLTADHADTDRMIKSNIEVEVLDRLLADVENAARSWVNR